MLIDAHGRTIDYLRVSVTQACNFRCRYCMPTTPLDYKPKEDLLSVDELFLFLKSAIDEGIKKIRITGGEPTLRDDLPEIFAKLFTYKPDVELALTTNGLLMDKYAQKYFDAGLRRVNISLDSLKRDVAAKIAGRDILDDVLKGIDASIKAGIRVKLNMVPLMGYNENEIVDLLDFSQKKGVMLRYIEQMANAHAPDVVGMKADQILEIIKQKYSFTQFQKDHSSPAKLYNLENGYMFGVIEPHKDDFCETCNRVRLSADGKLIPCLYFDEAISVKDALAKNDGVKAIEIFKKMLAEKPLKNRWSEGEGSNRAFYYTGG